MLSATLDNDPTHRAIAEGLVQPQPESVDVGSPQLGAGRFHGKGGELRQHYREGQEDQLGALGLVVNVIVLWNTIYMDAVIEQLRSEGYVLKSEDIGRLSPLMFNHINFLGRYAFALTRLRSTGPTATFEECR